MPLEHMPYTVVGFTDDLDWRPLQFVSPIPHIRVCSACGLVRTKTALLPCHHVLCESCYEQCVGDGLLLCPLDGIKCLQGDVIWIEFSVEELLAREVKCWNKERGCGSVMKASTISQHIRGECKHHSALCPKCSTAVLCTEVCAHLRSQCATAVPALPSKREESFRKSKETALRPPFNMAFQEQVGEMRVSLERLEADVATHGDRLNEIFRTMNLFKETLGSVHQGTRYMCDCLAKNMHETATLHDEIKSVYASRNDAVRYLENKNCDNFESIATAITEFITEANQTGQKTLDLLSDFLGHSQLDVSHLEFFVKGVESLQGKALKNGWAQFKSEQEGYIRGYCVLPGVHAQKVTDSVTLHLAFRILEGDLDDIIQWPLEHKIRLSIMHPSKSRERELEYKPRREDKNFHRPSGSAK